MIFHSKEILESDMLGTHKMAKDPIEKKSTKRKWKDDGLTFHEMTGGAFILGQPNLVNLASPCNGRGASIHELESWSIFYNTNLGLLPHIISGFLEVHQTL